MDGGRLFFQVFRITVGFIASLLTAGFFLSWGLYQNADLDSDPIAFAAMVGTGVVTAAFIGAMVLVPAFAVILAAELLSFRGVVYHLGAAGLIGFLLWTIDNAGDTGGLPAGTTVVLAASFLGGFVYWVIAGRLSGRWRGGS